MGIELRCRGLIAPFKAGEVRPLPFPTHLLNMLILNLPTTKFL